MLSIIISIISSILIWIGIKMVYIGLFIYVCYLTGWLHRFLWFAAEYYLKVFVLNGTTITASSIEYNFLRGQYTATNVIIHAPQRVLWKWKAPILARMGYVYVEFNLLQCLLYLILYQEEIPIEFYTIHIQDIQVFIEQKYGIYNFFLLDPSVILPDPSIFNIQQENNSGSSSSSSSNNNSNNGVDERTTTAEEKKDDNEMEESNNSNRTNNNSNNQSTTSISNNNNDDDDAAAQKVVNDMLQAVRQAAVKGEPAAALDHYRQTVLNQLKNHTINNKSGNGSTTYAATLMRESVNLVKHVAANITQTTVQAQQVVLPARNEEIDMPTIYSRVGRVILTNLRIFVGERNDLYISSITMRSNEFCPPSTAPKDKITNFPPIYTTLDAIIEVMWKRVLAAGPAFWPTALQELADAVSNSNTTNNNNNNTMKSASSQQKTG